MRAKIKKVPLYTYETIKNPFLCLNACKNKKPPIMILQTNIKILKNNIYKMFSSKKEENNTN